MKKEEIHLWDIKRILFGQAPPEFLLEVLIRSLIIYIAAIVVMRLLGKRMNAQSTIVELSVMVMMGAIISVPMQVPDRGLLQGFLVLLLTLVVLRGINLIAFRSSRFEKILHGEAGILVKNGVLNLKELSKTRITPQQVYEQLRNRRIVNLGKVKRMYLEGCGIFSVYTEEENKPGLPLFPPDDTAILEEQKEREDVACVQCGTVKRRVQKSDYCNHCGSNEFVTAIS